jgi:hypothetical protein
VRAQAAVTAALFFVFEFGVADPQHAGASISSRESTFSADRRYPIDLRISKTINYPSKKIYFQARELYDWIVERHILDRNHSSKSRAESPLVRAEIIDRFWTYRKSVRLPFVCDEYSISQRHDGRIRLADISDSNTTMDRIPALENGNGWSSIGFAQGYVDNSNSGPVNQNKSFPGNLRLISSSLGSGFRGVHCDGRGVGRFFGDRNRLLRMASVDLRDPPQAIGRPPEGARENCRSDDGESGDCIVVEPQPKPMPNGDDQMNKQGTNGLILIAGIAVALCIAFRRKPPPFRSERHRHESDSTESG